MTAAQIELQGAKDHLASAQSRGDVLGTLAAQADVVAKTGGLVTATVDQGKRDADFLKNMDINSTGQTLA